MLSINYELSVPKFTAKEIGYLTLVRSYDANLTIELTNDGQRTLSKLSVRLVIESYVGQDKPSLFVRRDGQTIEQIRPQNMVPLTFDISSNFPGLVSVAIYVTDASNNAVMSKREEETSYNESPVRYWFHVIDNIPIETLRVLRSLLTKAQENKSK